MSATGYSLERIERHSQICSFRITPKVQQSFETVQHLTCLHSPRFQTLWRGNLDHQESRSGRRTVHHREGLVLNFVAPEEGAESDFRAVTVISIFDLPINLAIPTIVRVGRGSEK